MRVDDSRKKHDTFLGSEPYKRLKQDPEIIPSRAIIRLEGYTPSPLESSMKSLTDNSPQTETAKTSMMNKEKEKASLEKSENRHRSENKTQSSQDQWSYNKTTRKPAEKSFKPQSYQQSYQVSSSYSRQQNIPPELKSDRVYSALIRSTPHIKLNGSLYDNQIILVLPSSLFGK